MQKYVYLLETIDNYGDTIYKIGITKNSIQERIKQLQTGNPYPIKITSYYETSIAEKVEGNLHRRYKHLKLKGEWFSLDIGKVCSFYEDCLQIEKNYLTLQENTKF